MQKKNHHFLLFCFLLFFAKAAQAVTLTSGQTDYTTTGDITTSSTGISSTLVGTSSSLNKITNTYTITTGNSGGTSSAYGIKVTGNYNQITNDTGAAILNDVKYGGKEVLRKDICKPPRYKIIRLSLRFALEVS